MYLIKLDQYMPQLSGLYAFYRYSESEFSNENNLTNIFDKELETQIEYTTKFLKPEFRDSQNVKERIERQIREKIKKDIDDGLIMLRRQILETSHSIFEKYLCHVVRVYLHIFPEILMEIEKQIHYREIVGLRNNDSIFDFMVEKEVSSFSRRSLEEKKKYMANHLRYTSQDIVWTENGKEIWRDIDKKRQAIVHEESVPEISHDYLLRAVNHLQYIMIKMAIYAQADQGIKFAWGPASDFTRSKEKPTLKSKPD